MFETNPISRLCWFTNNSKNDASVLDEYKLIGIVLGLAIYNSVILDLHFPIFLYKKLLDKETNLEDLCMYDPELGNSLKKLFDMNEDELALLNFEISYTALGETNIHQLKENGNEITLSKENVMGKKG